jgi:hypothetical protein
MGVRGGIGILWINSVKLETRKHLEIGMRLVIGILRTNSVKLETR